jgi:hypothetical protein
MDSRKGRQAVLTKSIAQGDVHGVRQNSLALSLRELHEMIMKGVHHPG